MVKLWHDIPMGALFVLIRLGWLAFFQYSLLMKQTTSTVYPPRKDWKYYHKKAPCPR